MALKPVDKKKNPGLSKLPTGVRNKMGYMKDDGMFALGEDVTISEGTDDLCSSYCEIKITVINYAESTVLYEGYVSVQ